MRWTTKSRLQRACAPTAVGRRAYVELQKRFGTLTGSPTDRLPTFLMLLEWMREAGLSPVGARCLEVGTGQKATLPLLLGLCGAESVTTVDLNQRLHAEIMQGVVAYVLDHEDELVADYAEFVPMAVLRERFAQLRATRDRPTYLRDLGVEYVAPGDAAALTLADDSIDLHFSVTVFEHIPRPVLIDILAEAGRVLAPSGVAIHFIDLSDHFAHQDDSISLSNFLRYSEAEWAKLGGNELGYCNRLRSPDFEEIFEAAGMKALRSESAVDQRSLAAITSGELVPHTDFAHHAPEVLATSRRDVVLAPI